MAQKRVVELPLLVTAVLYQVVVSVCVELPLLATAVLYRVVVLLHLSAGPTAYLIYNVRGNRSQ